MRRHLHALFAAVLIAGQAHALVWPNVVERTEKALTSDDVEARRRAAATLPKLPEASGRRLVARALADEDVEVRLLAVAAAAELRLEGLGRLVATWLSEPDARLRRSAAWALRLDPTTEANAALARALSDADVSVRLAAAEALGESENAEATLPLLGRLDDSHPEVRIAAIRALGRSGDARAVVPLVGKAQDNVIEVRREVARALGSLGDARAVSALVMQLTDREEDVRAASLEALGRLGSGEATPAIHALLEVERRGRVRRAAYAALGRISGGGAVDVLFEWLARGEPGGLEPVYAAIAGLGPAVHERLTACVDGEAHAAVADGCALALGASGAPDAALHIAGALRRGVIRPAAGLQALATADDRRALPAVLEYLAHDDGSVRNAAIQASAVLLEPSEGDGRAVQPIIKALDAASRQPRERLALVALLGRTGSPRAAIELAKMLDGADDPVLRRAAARGLGWVPSESGGKALLQALDDTETEVRFEAAVALGRSGQGALARELLDRYERAPRQDRGAIVLALAGVLARARGGEITRRLERLASSRVGEERDGIIEVLGAAPGEAGTKPLVALLRQGADAATRAKVAEALAAHPDAAATLLTLASDADGAVRANAVWALGVMGRPEHAERLASAMKDSDVAVAGNAVAALGLLGSRGAPALARLCAALTHRHPYVRANALLAAALIGKRCDAAAERRLLGRDPSEVVRAAAARLLSRLPSAKRDRHDEDALTHCRDDDPSGRVAAACMQVASPLARERDAVTVYVVPESRSRPAGRVPFALARPDGLMRLGVTDRRGAVREIDVPRGEIRLEIPAPLVAK